MTRSHTGGMVGSTPSTATTTTATANASATASSAPSRTTNRRILGARTGLRSAMTASISQPGMGTAPTSMPLAGSASAAVTMQSSLKSVLQTTQRATNAVAPAESLSKKRSQDEDDEDDELMGIDKSLKRMRVDVSKGPVIETATTNLAAIAPAGEACTEEADDMDDLDHLDGIVRRKPVETAAPGGQQEDDASDYYPSDLDEGQEKFTPASRQRRIARAASTVSRMAAHFSKLYPTASKNLFQPSAPLTTATTRTRGKAAAVVEAPVGLPWHWVARLRRFNAEECRWVEKGPVVLMILPCREESPSEGRLVAHFAFGTMSVALNMPISDLHHKFIRSAGRRILLSSVGNNIVAKAVVNQVPRKLRDLMQEMTQRDQSMLMEVEGRSAGANTELDVLAQATVKLMSAAQKPAAKKSSSKMRDVSALSSEDNSSASSPEKLGKVSRQRKSENTQAKTVPTGGTDYVYECLTTVVPAREEASSLFILVFQEDAEAATFVETFTNTSIRYGCWMTEERLKSYSQPQPVQRLLLTGQVVNSAEGRLQISPLAKNIAVARKMAETGLGYTPVLADTESNPQHRFTCQHCHATVALRDAEQVNLEAILSAHQNHPLATRWGSYHRGANHQNNALIGGFGKGWYQAYKCTYAYERVDKNASPVLSECIDSLVHNQATSGGTSKGKRAAWDVALV